jgi:hypothetical protein
MTDAALTGQTVELLQQLIRNQCVNDGSAPPPGGAHTDVLRAIPAGRLDVGYEPGPGRTSLVAVSRAAIRQRPRSA